MDPISAVGTLTTVFKMMSIAPSAYEKLNEWRGKPSKKEREALKRYCCGGRKSAGDWKARGGDASPPRSEHGVERRPRQSHSDPALRVVPSKPMRSAQPLVGGTPTAPDKPTYPSCKAAEIHSQSRAHLARRADALRASCATPDR
jgi:hypothetical protein